MSAWCLSSQLPMSHMTTPFMASLGSPLVLPLQKVLGRRRAAGIGDRHGSLKDAVARGVPWSRQVQPRPLSMDQLWPCFALLTVGLLAATISFGLELHYSRRPSRRPPFRH